MGIHGKLTRVLVDGYNLSQYFSDAQQNRTKDKADVSGFGSTSKSYVVGLQDGTISLTGFHDGGAANGIDDRLSQSFSLDTDLVVTIMRNQGLIATNALLFVTHETDYSINSAIGGAVAVTAQMQSDGQINSGLVLHPLVAETAVSGTATSQDNGAATANGGVGHVHVTAASGTALAVNVDHSVDNVTFTNLIAFTATAAVGAQRIEVAAGTTVNRYVRVSWSMGASSSFTFAVAFARR